MNKKLILLAILLISISVLSVYLKEYTPHDDVTATHTENKEETNKDKNLDGKYVLMGASSLSYDDVSISSSTESSLYYSINTTHLGHVGSLSGDAFRDTSTSSLVYKSTDFHKDESQQGCQVYIVFDTDMNLSYITRDISVKVVEDKDEYTANCSNYRGQHGEFFDGDIHEKGVVQNLYTLENLGFTKSDKEMFNSMSKDITSVEMYADLTIGYDNETGSGSDSAQKIDSTDIKNSFGYRIESPNVYNGMNACDFIYDGGGYCLYGAFLKDNNGSYWMMGGSNYANTYDDKGKKMLNPKQFVYKTNKKEWKNKLPQAFMDELDRLGVDLSLVDFKS